jgi:hypothetical protein
MRLYISLYPRALDPQHVTDRFIALGGDVELCLPAERRLGEETVDRGFFHLQIDNADQQKVQRMIQAVCASEVCAFVACCICCPSAMLRS